MRFWSFERHVGPFFWLYKIEPPQLSRIYAPLVGLSHTKSATASYPLGLYLGGTRVQGT